MTCKCKNPVIVSGKCVICFPGTYAPYPKHERKEEPIWSSAKTEWIEDQKQARKGR